MINNAVIMGRLVADPELRATGTGINVTSFTVAVERRFKNGEERVTDYIDVVAWRSTADFVTKYFKKGSMIALSGSIQTRSYEDKNGNKRKSVEIVADNVSFCGSKTEAGGSAAGADDFRRDEPAAGYSTASAGDFSEITEDDLPF